MIQQHYYYFGKEMQKKMKGNSLNEENWDLLRNDEADGPFSIEKTVESYENNCRKAVSYERAAGIILQELENNNIVNKIVSLGAGKGILEWHLKNIKPNLVVECTDYTAEAIEKLKAVFPRMDNGYTFDMLNGDYKALGQSSSIVMYRVSTEFSRDQWVGIFKKMFDDGMERIVFVPTGLDSILDMWKEKIRHILSTLMGHKDILCGWLYSEDEFLKMFKGDGEKPLYIVAKKIPFENTAIYFLCRNSNTS